jgi:two-component sensor histidine kinase
MNMPSADTLLQSLEEPAFLLTRAGIVTQASRAGLLLLGRPATEVVGHALVELLADPPDHLATLLRRSLGSSQVSVGAVQLRSADGPPRRVRWRGCRIADGPAAEPILLLLLDTASSHSFTALTSKMVALNAELARNRRIQVQLRRALDEKEMLLRELNHRVKNNLQTLLGILMLAENRATGPSPGCVIQDMRLRLEAIGVVQGLLYRQADIEGIDALDFLRDLCSNVERALGRPGIVVEVVGDGGFIGLDVASPLGLIVNELLTNAFKHAFGAGARGTVKVGLTRSAPPAEALVLTVEDDGCGLDPHASSGTGLVLVRGLARQLGASFVIETHEGVRCMLTLDRRERSAADDDNHRAESGRH